MHRYVHGYSERETRRLYDQARILEDLLHKDTRFSGGSRVLEIGCGVGAQTAILAERSPKARIEAVDISVESLKEARNAVNRDGINGVS
ncbi:MAG: class I SAM-dependent methyltransferase, partial [Dehalococcoidales bacterium]